MIPDSKPWGRRFAVLLLSTLLILSMACGQKNRDRSHGPFLLLAASSLTATLGAALENFAKSPNGFPVQTSFASSHSLARQIHNGVDCDLFISADPRHVLDLIDAGLVAKNEEWALWSSRLILAGTGDATQVVSERLHAATRIGIGDVGVPAGDYARAALGTMGLGEALSDKLVPLASEAAVAEAIRRGNVDVGFVYETSSPPGKALPGVGLLPGPDAPAVRYAAALPASSRQTERAHQLLEYLTRGEGAKLFEASGFGPAPNRASGW